MSKGSYKLGEKLEISANRLFAHLDELAVALESIKAQFPKPPVVESGEPGGSLAWAPLEQTPRNLIFMFQDWNTLQLRDQRFRMKCRQEIRISFAA